MPNAGSDIVPRIAVDAMGGDFGPHVVVPAAVQAARNGIAVVLVGDAERIESELSRLNTAGLDITVRAASQVVEMDDKPSDALRRKKDSSIQVACRCVTEGVADGVVSAGNSGATVACGMFVLGRIKGVMRPALAGIMPTEKNPVVLIDVGANVDSKPLHLLQFALMADVLSRYVLGVPNPAVGLLSIGEEEGKGNATVRDAFELLRQSDLRFIGNVEGRDIFTGDVDVVVCDGFVGNVALKLSEGLAKSMGNILRTELKSSWLSRLGTLLSLRAFKRFKKVVDYAEYGGAPLIGLKGLVVVCHGKSNELAMVNAIKMAATSVRNKMHEHLAEGLAAHSSLAGKFEKTAKDAA
ncbi:MAG: phosphate acyltransferase PlsX [Pseudodesulfovibrio sp.]|uniref:Phosphate acyltransferase n=1 Tax=Pseudodesulfovibrio aespoeensis (strain ATCC 700646 / DSM 10631 / Aspo-2) TaxID=643562 RepID=E6VXH8_PSEA9|nr:MULTISPECIES: phosphate acyltransferase PlsX [Pseudodesulfovibrio]MBU4190849.1 phosphate acyltransferase PlsX [Pseudomonadota bacterium]ADU63794.1 fatty acid/phospholipid synthesis protein PlsX [Pseudodesulfovibrio aespoeensis Aspo-2]MBU4242772.1 phosphate acyltransferase PlsX [Pseudomonadota bacterium]MBU4378008.1 phosphate acyltransferase PlsX [Pseudomonadota bacterium]MBU4475619.1 phosphate acyltransferase PlsX [Pseudomonadota bacterium]